MSDGIEIEQIVESRPKKVWYFLIYFMTFCIVIFFSFWRIFFTFCNNFFLKYKKSFILMESFNRVGFKLQLNIKICLFNGDTVQHP